MIAPSVPTSAVGSLSESLRRKSWRFPLEAREAHRVLRHASGKHLDRDLAIELRVARPLHLAHPARAEGRDDLVGAEVVSGEQGQVGTP
jgi:hypothetical protein